MAIFSNLVKIIYDYCHATNWDTTISTKNGLQIIKNKKDRNCYHEKAFNEIEMSIFQDDRNRSQVHLYGEQSAVS